MSADRFTMLRPAQLVACSAGYRCGKYARLAMLQGSSPVLGSFGGLSPMVLRVVGVPVLLAGMAKATSLGFARGLWCAVCAGVYLLAVFSRWGISI